MQKDLFFYSHCRLFIHSRQLIKKLLKNMAKICIEICIISARGLRRKSTLLKPQWFAVGWIDPNNKYCTKIDTSGSPNPTWKTKFSVLIDEGDPKLKDLSLTVEVHRREPIFLREHLQGVAVVPLKEFVVKFVHDGEGSRSLVEETRSFQLRKRSSGKPKGLADVSISISEETQGFASNYGTRISPNTTASAGLRPTWRLQPTQLSTYQFFEPPKSVIDVRCELIPPASDSAAAATAFIYRLPSNSIPTNDSVAGELHKYATK